MTGTDWDIVLLILEIVRIRLTLDLGGKTTIHPFLFSLKKKKPHTDSISLPGGLQSTNNVTSRVQTLPQRCVNHLKVGTEIGIFFFPPVSFLASVFRQTAGERGE